MSYLDAALALAAKGFHVFPLLPNAKTPAIEDFPEAATRDTVQIIRWWMDPVMEIPQPYNVGISTSRFGDDEALVVVDVDNKGDKHGDEELIRLELEGFELSETFEQRTPTGGRHLFYRVRRAVKQGVDILGSGLDIRSRGGYVVGAGSSVTGGTYTAIDRDLAHAPDWVISACGRGPEGPTPTPGQALEGVDAERAQARAIFYLEREAEVSVEGAGGDLTAYQVAARVKDHGVDQASCLELMLTHWNERCTPPWRPEDLSIKVRNAYQYGQEPIGSSAPEALFSEVTPEATSTPDPIQALNREFAFVVTGGGSQIIHETTDSEGRFELRYLSLDAFHQMMAPRTLMVDGKLKAISHLWMKSPMRRSYEGVCFLPGKQASHRFYNLWRGFAVEPLPPGEEPSRGMQQALDMFLEHALQNVCQGDFNLYQWLIGYFSHLVQKPWEKPNVALVFKGKKGVGKNALVERVGHLLGSHFVLVSDRRYLVGNFNSHLERTLLFTLDEAFWSGDKSADGILKGLITNAKHRIEQKGKESFQIDNRTRVCILGNEQWLVPATEDERRYAVFQVGEGRRQDRSFFRSMRELMEQGGYKLLLRYLLEYDLSKIDVDLAPDTEALLEQKIRTLEPLEQWWLDCLTEGRIMSSDLGAGWPSEVECESFRAAYRRHARERNVRGRLLDDRSFGKKIRDFCGSVKIQKRRVDKGFVNYYALPALEQARKEWEAHLGGREIKWE